MPGLIQRRDGRPGAADRQNPPVTSRIAQTAHEVGGEVLVTDGFAGGERAITKDQIRLAGTHPVDLPGERFEKRRGPDDAVVQPRINQRAFKREFGLLEGQLGFLHADSRDQYELFDARLLRRPQHIQMGSMVNGPGIGWRPSA